MPINGHFVPPLPKETLPPPPPPPVSSTIATTGLNEIVEDSDSQSRELPFSDSAVSYKHCYNTLCILT